MANQNTAITFEITVIQGRNLAPMDKEFIAIGKKTSSDPFVNLVYRGKKIGETKVILKTLSPTWNQKFKLIVHTSGVSKALEGHADYKNLSLQVFDKDIINTPDFMGDVLVALPFTASSAEPQTSWYPVGTGTGNLYCKKASGEIQVKISAKRGPGYPFIASETTIEVGNTAVEVGLDNTPWLRLSLYPQSKEFGQEQPPQEQHPWTSWQAFQATPYQRPPLKMQTASKYELSQDPILPSGRCRALIIGINYTGTKAELKGCANDAINMKKLLVQSGFNDDPTHMVVLSDDESAIGEEAKGNMDAFMPTAANIRRGMQWLVHNAQKGDILFFHFSGHGHQVVDKEHFEADGYNETILSSDYRKAGQICDDEIWGTMIYPLAAGARLTSLMDCCHSGTGLDLPYDYNVAGSKWVQDHNPALGKGDVILFSGCEDSQTSADIQSKRGKSGGAMTHSLLAALREDPTPTYANLIAKIRKQLKKRGFTQNPQLTSNQKFDVENRVFMLSNGIEPNRNKYIGRLKRSSIRLGKPKLVEEFEIGFPNVTTKPKGIELDVMESTL